MNQGRLILVAVISVAITFGFCYLFLGFRPDNSKRLTIENQSLRES